MSGLRQERRYARQGREHAAWKMLTAQSVSAARKRRVATSAIERVSPDIADKKSTAQGLVGAVLQYAQGGY
jgi:hypothetical protein